MMDISIKLVAIKSFSYNSVKSSIIIEHRLATDNKDQNKI